MNSLERFLVGVDVGAPGAAWRVAFGLAVPPLFDLVSGGRRGMILFAAFFVCSLFLLRMILALIRRLLPLSRQAKETWAERRRIAIHHDSYQWLKLFWVGLGMLPHAIAGNGLSNSVLAVTVVSLVGGCAGLFFWHRRGVARQAN